MVLSAEPFSPAVLSRPRVLVVDDEASIRLACVLTLRADGWDAQGEGSSRAALARLTTLNERYDALVFDYAMPEFTGLELTAALDPKTRPPILLASAHADGAVACSALKLGIWDFQAKPLVPAELRYRVRRMLTRSQDATEPDAWIARALGHCQTCAWAEALRELETWPEGDRREPAGLLTGLIYCVNGDTQHAALAFKGAQWWPEWESHGGEIWPELARRLG